ncbi:unnamed protein product, partial [Schistosoma curassoni]|uniref:Reverse transcriptase domain-containing protein n=1 Tax=Schistosoma curassoni TaxID=6186 RepID=A0A183KQM2_9TREM
MTSRVRTYGKLIPSSAPTESIKPVKYKSGSKKKEREGSNQNQPNKSREFKAKTEYTEANSLVKRSTRVDKQKYVKDIAVTVEKAAREEKVKQLHDTTNKLVGKYSKPERLVNDKENKTIAEIREARNRWVEHFEEHLDRPAPLNPLDIEAESRYLLIDVTPPTIEEIRMAIRILKSAKTTGPDSIP